MTSRVVRSQSTVGTRKSGSSREFSANSEAAAASSRKSISMRTERAASRRLDGPQPADSGARLSATRAAKDMSAEIAREAPLDAGAQNFDRDVARAFVSVDAARCTCAIEAAATGSPKFDEQRLDLPAEGGLDRWRPPRRAEGRDAVLQPLQIERRPWRRRYPAASKGIGRA